MSKKHWQNRFPDVESISDEEISLVIRYLDPDVKPKKPDVTVFIAVLGAAILLCTIVLWFHLGGLRFSPSALLNSLQNLRSLQPVCNYSLENCVGR